MAGFNSLGFKGTTLIIRSLFPKTQSRTHIVFDWGLPRCQAESHSDEVCHQHVSEEGHTLRQTFIYASSAVFRILLWSPKLRLCAFHQTYQPSCLRPSKSGQVYFRDILHILLLGIMGTPDLSWLVPTGLPSCLGQLLGLQDPARLQCGHFRQAGSLGTAVQFCIMPKLKVLGTHVMRKSDFYRWIS